MRTKKILEKIRSEKYYTSKDLMTAFGISSYTLSRWVNNGVLPDFPPPVILSTSTAKNAKWYWEKGAIKEWLRRHPEAFSCVALPD